MSGKASGSTVGSAAHLQMLLDAVTDYAIYMLDAEGRVSSWNTGAVRLNGYTAEEVMGRSYAMFFTEEDRAAGLPSRQLETARREGRFETEGWRQRKDGSRFWVSAVLDVIRDDAGRVLGFAKITRDITERHATQEALAESEKRFRLLVDGVIDYAIFMLDTEGRVSSWNAGAQRLKGYTDADIIGEHFSRFYTEEDRRAGLPERALKTAARHGKFESEGWRLRQDGSRFWASVVIDAVRDETGALVGFAKVTRDISERREAQQALEQTRTALAQAQKMEAIGQLTGGIAHDFNNLLTVIINNLDLVLQDKSDPRRVDRLAQAAQRAAERGAKLTQQLLAFGRRQPLRPEVLDAAQLLRGYEPLLRRAAGDAVTLVLEPGADPKSMRVDPAQFEAALLNLTFNARDAMAKGGQLRIGCQSADVAAGGAAARAGVVPGSYVVVSIADEGEGMTPEVLERAFEPFFTTREPGRGTGLGLSQVYGFVNQSGGHVIIESRPGRGTTVRLFLPAVDPARPAPPKETAQPQMGTVLVVEDDPDVLQSTVEMVRGLGYQVLTAGDGFAALAVLKGEVPVDILFSDVVMPKGMNGVELAREARKLRPTLRVILSSGYANSILTAEHGLTRDFAFIGKPYRWPDLAEKLRGGAVH